MYDIVGSPSKDSSRLTLKLSRVKASDNDSLDNNSPVAHTGVDHDSDSMNNNNNNNQVLMDGQELSHRFTAEEQVNCQQTPVQTNTKDTEAACGVTYEDSAEMDAQMDTDIERIECESVNDRERWSKDVQDKGEFTCSSLLFLFFLFFFFFWIRAYLNLSVLCCR